MKTTHYLLLILVLLLIRLQPAISQPYVDGGKTRHRFAQTHFGILQRYFPGTSGSLSFPGGLMEPLADLHETRLIIGGMHFWGHADFLLTIPVYRSRREGYASGVETAFRYFPWRVRDQVVRPFAGVALSSSDLEKAKVPPCPGRMCLLLPALCISEEPGCWKAAPPGIHKETEPIIPVGTSSPPCRRQPGNFPWASNGCLIPP
jgi:hypothetical protein